MEYRQRNIALNFISRYCILINGKVVERKIIGWRTALAHARNRLNPLFEPNKIIEILNIWTGEIITLQEAEKRAAKIDSMRKLNQSLVQPHEAAVRT